MSPSFALKLAKLVAVVAATAVAVHAESPPPAPYAERLEAFMRTQMQQYNIPGAAVAIVRQGEVEHLAGYGRANAAGDPVPSDTPFLLASVSKSFTALGVMQLAEQGRIELDAAQKGDPG